MMRLIIMSVIMMIIMRAIMNIMIKIKFNKENDNKKMLIQILLLL